MSSLRSACQSLNLRSKGHFLPQNPSFEMVLNALILKPETMGGGVATVTITTNMEEREAAGNTYLLRPSYQHKFKAAAVRECVREILQERLSEQRYDPEQVPGLSRSLAENIKDKLKDVGFERYKFVAQVVIGEQRGQGVKMASRCFWDADTDGCVEEMFVNDSLFCVAAVFGCYYY